MDEHSTEQLESMARTLQASGQYSVLRRLHPRSVVTPNEGSATRKAIFVDVETTGLDPSRDEVIELAMIPFTYGLDGQIFEVGTPFQCFREPIRPIPSEITTLTGITDEMVAGHTIDPSKLIEIVDGAALVIAHNAAFDRRFCEILSPVFALKPWACSMTQVDWKAEGFEGTKLAYLAMGAGFFYDRHRASHDCLAAIELLAMTLPVSRKPAMSHLLERARRPTWRIWAEDAPFELKGLLKARGYRWNGEGNANPRGWYIDVEDDVKEQEIAFLRSEIYQRESDLLVKRVTALERFSTRT